MEIVKIRKKEYRETLFMVYDSFRVFNAESYNDSGRASFMNYASFDNFSARQKHGYTTFLAKEHGDIAGMTEIRADRHIAMLFVSPAYIRRGFGRALVEHAVGYVLKRGGKSAELTVNASPYAHGFYLRMGFVELGPAVNRDGLICTPMSLALPGFGDIMRQAAAEL